jgi:hypothetical protein
LQGGLHQALSQAMHGHNIVTVQLPRSAWCLITTLR